MHISEPIVATLITVGEAFMVDPEEVEYGGLQVVDMDGILDGCVAELVGGSVGGAAADAPACHEEGEALDGVGAA